MILEDGSGNGFQAKVTDQNMLGVDAIKKDIEYYNNIKGNFYSTSVLITPDSTNSCFFYIKNKNDKILVIKRIGIYTTINETILCYVNDIGTPIGGINYTPINRNIGSNKLCDCETKYSSQITGLSGGSLFDRFHVLGDNQTHIYRWQAGVIIPKNRIFTLYAQNGGAELDLTLTFFS